MTAMDAAARLTPEERSRLLRRADELPGALGRPLAGCVLNAWAIADPANAAAWVLTRLDPLQVDDHDKRNLDAVMYSWLSADEQEAKRWWQGLPESPAKLYLGNAVAADLARRGLVEETLKYFSASEAPAYVVAAIAEKKAEKDPADAVEWLAGLPQRAETAAAFNSALKVWLAKDPAAAAAWADSQAPGPRRDEVLAAFARGAATIDSAAATAWVGSVRDPQRRQAAVEDVYRDLRRSDPAGAAALLESLPVEDAAFSARLLRWTR